MSEQAQRTRQARVGTDTGVGTAVATLALVGLSAATVVGMCRVFAGWAFVRPLLTVVLTLHLASWVTRRVRFHPLVSVLVLWLALIETLAVTFYRGSLHWWLPSAATVDAVRADVHLAWSQFPTAVSPVVASGPFVVVAAIALGIAALLSDAFAFRALGRLEAVLPSGVVFIFTAAFGTSRGRIASSALWFAMAYVVIALVGQLAQQPRQQRGAVTPNGLLSVVPTAAACAAICALGAAWVGPALPGAHSDALIEPRRGGTDTGTLLSPLVDIRSRLIRLSDIELFTVGAEQPRYWRATGLSEFDGTMWTQATDELSSPQSLTPPEDRPVLPLAQGISIARLTGVLVPAAYSPIAISATSTAWLAESQSVVVTGEQLSQGDFFNIISNIAVPQPDELRSAGPGNPDPRLTALPDDFPEAVTRLAHAVTDGQPTTYDKALALQNYFRDNFTYDLTVQRGNGDDAIVSFLQNKRGYCEQFSATFAAMGRAIGLPTRVAVGFTQGDLRSDGQYHVLGRYAHAWPEVWFGSLGWVMFEPTPGRGAPGSEAVTGVAAAQATGPTPGPTGPSVATVPRTTVPKPTVTTVRPTGNGGASASTTVPSIGGTGGGGKNRPWGVLAWVLLGMLVLAAWAAFMPTFVRRFLRTGSTPAEQVISAWHGSVASLELAGAPAVGGDTPLEYARHVEAILGVDARTLDELARFVTRAVYSPQSVGEPTALRAAILHHQLAEASSERMAWYSRLSRRFDPRVVKAMEVGRPVSATTRRGPWGPAGASTPVGAMPHR